MRLDNIVGYVLVGGGAFVGLLALALVVILPVLAGGEKRRRLAQVQQYRLSEVEDQAEAGTPGGAVGRTALAVTERVVRSYHWDGYFARQVDRAGFKMRPHEWVLLRVLIGFGVAVLLTVLFGLIGLPFGLLFGWLTSAAYHRHRARRKADRFAAALPEALQLIIGSLRSGFSLLQAIDAMVREVEDPIASEFSRVIAETRLGMDLEDALLRLASRTHNQDLAWTVMAVKVQREVGGNLAEVLESTVSAIRERELLRSHVRSLSAEGRMSAWILIALPIVVAAFMVVFRRDYVALLFTDPRGVLMMLTGVALLCVGGFWISRLVRVEV